MAFVGQVIDDKYEILTEIGHGGMSKVFLARDKRLNKQWAVKEIQKRATDRNNEIVVQSAIAEANMIKQLDHPSIVRIVDIIETDEVIYIIEDYIEGETLNSILDENGAQPQELVIEWAKQICTALEYLHTRKPPIIYRDMKPANVMLKPDGNIKIIDFGIAREYKEQSVADTISLGTKGYAAPEQFGGRGQTDPRTDIYCLGVTLYHLVTGHSPCDPPYEIYPIRHWNPQLDPGLEAVILKCTQLNPEDRYQSCAELLYALKHYKENSAAYRAKQRRKLHTFVGTVCACVAFAAVGVTGLVMRTQANNADYQHNLDWANQATFTEEKLEYYNKAIEIKPDELAPYQGIIAALGEDALFTAEEEAELKNSIGKTIKKNSTTTRIELLRQQNEYGALAFEIGKLYWYYYDGDDLMRRTSSVTWFKEALDYGGEKADYHVMASVYYDIGKFKADIAKKVAEGEDALEMYQGHWEDINNFLSLIRSDKDSSDIVKVEAYTLALESIESYADKFRRAKISREDMDRVYQAVVDGLNDMSTTPGKIEDMWKNAEAHIAPALDQIEKAYREDR